MPGAIRSIAVSDWTSTLVNTGVVLLIVYVINRYIGYRKTIWNVVTLSKPKGNFRELIADALKKFPDQPYRLPMNHHPVVVMPTKYLDEIRALPEEQLGFMAEVQQRFLGKYTGLGDEPHESIAAIKTNLTQNIGKTLEALQDEVDFSVTQEIGPCDDWTETHIYGKVLRIVAMVSGRVFVGLPLCRNEEWINIEVNYTIQVMNAVYKYWNYSSWQRPIVIPWLKETKVINEYRANAQRLMRPIIAERLKQLENPDYESPSDLIQWVLEQSGDRKTDIWLQAHSQLGASFAAIHTTTMNVSHLLYEIGTHPEIVEPLREEIQQLLKEDGGKLLKTSMNRLRKFDSFMKETQRHNPPSLVTMGRYACQDVHLSDGTKIPRGNFVAFASDSVNMDPELWDEPEKFDAFRFEKLRAQPGGENKYQFVKTGSENLNFGHGRHACPGRFFASNEIKIILAYIILNYDVKLKDGEGRPENFYKETSIGPNTSAKILLKRRRADLGW